VYIPDAPRGRVVVPPRDVRPLGVSTTGADNMDRSRRDRRAELGAVVRRYAAHNDRFEQWLNERDADARERQRARFAGLSDDVRRELGGNFEKWISRAVRT
jgi:hypothetical protein